MMYCQSCGAEARPAFRFCPACGGKQFGPGQPGGQVQVATQTTQRPPAPLPPSGLPASRLPTPPVVARSSIDVSAMQYSGFWRRAAAFGLDYLFQSIVTVPVVLIAAPSNDQELAIFYLCGAVFAWLYYALQESSQHQGTFGKRIMGLVVSDMQGQRLSFARATGHHFARFPSALLLFAGYFMALFTERRQTLHDKIAGVVVLSRGA